MKTLLRLAGTGLAATGVWAATLCPAARAIEATHPALRASKLPPLIPARELAFQRGGRWAYRISPDGKRIAWQGRSRRGILLHVENLDDGARKTFRIGRPSRFIRWAYDNRRLVYFRDWNGDENERLFVIDTETPEARPERLTPLDGVKAILARMPPDDPAHIVIRMNRRDRTLFDLYRVNIQTGETTLVEKNPGDVLNWVVDRKGRAVARYRRLKNGDRALETRRTSGEAWSHLVTAAFDRPSWISHVSHDGRYAWGGPGVGRDKNALVRLDLRTGAEEVVFGNDMVDIEQSWVDPETDKPLMALTQDGYPKLHYFDSGLRADLSSFAGNGPADIRLVSHSRDLMRLMILLRTDRGRRTYYLFDRKTKKKTLLFKDPMGRFAESLSPMIPVSFKARDGLQLHGYLTVPTGTGGGNLPMVLKVHGGPATRDYWQYDQMVQFLANRGYAVLQVNYRGSSGYGLAFRRAIRREYARKAHDDLIDGVNWAIAKGIADPGNIAIYGRSYGGYAALVGVTFTPNVFKAGVDIVGMSALIGIKSKSPPYWKLIGTWRDYVGDPSKPEDRADMRSRSPLYFVDRIKSPLLVIHGANDVRVPREHSDRMVDAMRKTGKEVDYLLFEDEGHRLTKPGTRIQMMKRIETFLAQHLGGRTED